MACTCANGGPAAAWGSADRVTAPSPLMDGRARLARPLQCAPAHSADRADARMYAPFSDFMFLMSGME
jgi:hypothetical protein